MCTHKCMQASTGVTGKYYHHAQLVTGALGIRTRSLMIASQTFYHPSPIISPKVTFLLENQHIKMNTEMIESFYAGNKLYYC